MPSYALLHVADWLGTTLERYILYPYNHVKQDMAVGQNQRYHFGVGAPPIFFFGGLGCPLGVRAFDPWPYLQGIKASAFKSDLIQAAKWSLAVRRRPFGRAAGLRLPQVSRSVSPCMTRPGSRVTTPLRSQIFPPSFWGRSHWGKGRKTGPATGGSFALCFGFFSLFPG